MTLPLDIVAIEQRRKERWLQDWAHTCLRKIRYENSDEAVKGLRRLKRRHGVQMYFYPCNYCHGYHLTKRPPR